LGLVVELTPLRRGKLAHRLDGDGDATAGSASACRTIRRAVTLLQVIAGGATESTVMNGILPEEPAT
jgi:hypothetical protein